MERDAEREVDWVHPSVIATVARLLCREVTLRNEYLLPGNRTLKSKIPGRLRFTDEERRSLIRAVLGPLAHVLAAYRNRTPAAASEPLPNARRPCARVLLLNLRARHRRPC